MVANISIVEAGAKYSKKPHYHAVFSQTYPEMSKNCKFGSICRKKQIERAFLSESPLYLLKVRPNLRVSGQRTGVRLPVDSAIHRKYLQCRFFALASKGEEKPAQNFSDYFAESCPKSILEAALESRGSLSPCRSVSFYCSAAKTVGVQSNCFGGCGGGEEGRKPLLLLSPNPFRKMMIASA
ncbi:MAG: hypothetical protein ACK5LX_07390 [Oscillospiraceae bacterium]